MTSAPPTVEPESTVSGERAAVGPPPPPVGLAQRLLEGWAWMHAHLVSHALPLGLVFGVALLGAEAAGLDVAGHSVMWAYPPLVVLLLAIRRMPEPLPSASVSHGGFNPDSGRRERLPIEGSEPRMATPLLTPVPSAPPRAPSAPAPGAQERSAESLFHVVVSPLAGTFVLTALAGGSAPLETAFIAFVAFLCAAFVVRPEGRWTALLPFMAVVSRGGAPLLGVAVLAGLELGTGLPDAGPVELAAAGLVTAVASAVPKVALGTIWKPNSALRVAVIGSEQATRALSKELELAGVSRYTVMGRVRMADEAPGRLAPGEIHDLGGVEDLSRIVREGEIHLLIMTGEVPRLAVFNEIARSCLEMPVRLQDLSGFYEEVFGHVPVAEINASWFQYIMHPRYRPEPPPSKRVLDLAVAVVMGALFLPLLGFLALLIKRDGGPAFFKQVRIGDGGRPFTVYKLRTMTVGAPSAAQWASVDDPRITRLGRILRKSHLDEFPQLINVFRGEMSIVGPRPEQPEFVEQLEGWVPYYSRRHLLKPGITGWAQVRCGYAGSDVGSAWKLCHDLYYLKHRSTAFDLIILGETIRTLFADRQYAVEPKSVSFILNPDRIVVEASPQMAITSAS